MNKLAIKVGNKFIGEDCPCFIVAEAGVNHNGSLKLAKKLIDQAKAVGADAVKFQIFIPDEIVTRHAEKGDYQKETTGERESQYEMLRRLALSEEEFANLKVYAKEKGIIFYATVHDLASVDIFARLDLPIIKIASPDLNNGLLLYKIAKNRKLTKKPLFLSTGGSTMKDVKKSLKFLRDRGYSEPILVYHCTSSYPTPTNQQNLAVVKTFWKKIAPKFGVLVGFSDNGDDVHIPVDAVILGAISIEKHMTLDKNMEGPDHRSSLSGLEFAEMVRKIREVEFSGTRRINVKEALGDGVKKIQLSEANNIDIFRKAVRARVNLSAGTKISFEVLNAKRTRGTFNPLDFEQLLGKRLNQDVIADQEITPALVS